jgi:glycosyltransferase involved in cell wall biosynthesis
MKIVHCCLAAFYIDGFGYQENVLPRFHKRMGHDVEIVASTETYVGQKALGYTEARSYIGDDGLQVTRLPYLPWLPHALGRKLRVYSGLRRYLEDRRPEVIFVHDCQFVGINEIARYAERNVVRVFVDCHADLVNSGRTWLSRHVLHGIVYKWCAKRVEPLTERFYATLPLRAVFLEEVYGVSPDKIELLPFGVDDSELDFGQRSTVRARIREQLGIGPDETVFVSGGKIDRRKNIHVLVRTFIDTMARLGRDDAKLIIFGTPTDEMGQEISDLVRHPHVRYVGWLSPDEISEFLWAADVAVFPGTHSVIWEQAVGLGVPCVFNRWDGIEHVDVGGNCLFLERAVESTLGGVLSRLVTNPMLRRSLEANAAAKGPDTFRYSRIAARALGNTVQSA